MKRTLLSVLVIGLLLLSACGAPSEGVVTEEPAVEESAEETVAEEPATEEPVKEPESTPATFTISDLVISPTEVKPDYAMLISVVVTNDGDLAGSYEVIYKIDNEVIQIKGVTLDGGASQKVELLLKMNYDPGTYSIDVNGLLGAFTSEGKPSPIVVTGSGDKTSPPFTITTEEWVIDWSYVPNPEWPEMAVFGFFVYPRGETAIFVESVLFPEGTSGTTYSYAGTGEYYIKVSAANVKSWEVVISPP